MGFKCPLCQEDFGINKQEWKDHCTECYDGGAQEVVDSVIEMAEGEDHEETK